VEPEPPKADPSLQHARPTPFFMDPIYRYCQSHVLPTVLEEWNRFSSVKLAMRTDRNLTSAGLRRER